LSDSDRRESYLRSKWAMHKARLSLNRSQILALKEDKLKNLNTTKNRKNIYGSEIA